MAVLAFLYMYNRNVTYMILRITGTSFMVLTMMLAHRNVINVSYFAVFEDVACLYVVLTFLQFSAEAILENLRDPEAGPLSSLPFRPRGGELFLFNF